ncbi:MAG: hypothetical protein LUE27_08290 [Clostridia bacterium]|nr:hypothetical protein [Clostridia bacterium]
MDLLELYNTQENLEKAKKLLMEHATEQYDAEEYDFFASAFLCALCDDMCGGLAADEIEGRLLKYCRDDSDENLMAVISGLRYSQLICIEDRETGKPVIRTVNMVADDGTKRKCDVMTLLTAEFGGFGWIEPSQAMHRTYLNVILNLCDEAGVDSLLIDPVKDAVSICTDTVKHYTWHLNTAAGTIRMIRRAGIKGEDLFYPLLMSFSGKHARCEIPGGVFSGKVSLDDDGYLYDEYLTDFTLRDSKTGIELKLPMREVISINEIEA